MNKYNMGKFWLFEEIKNNEGNEIFICFPDGFKIDFNKKLANYWNFFCSCRCGNYEDKFRSVFSSVPKITPSGLRYEIKRQILYDDLTRPEGVLFLMHEIQHSHQENYFKKIIYFSHHKVDNYRVMLLKKKMEIMAWEKAYLEIIEYRKNGYDVAPAFKKNKLIDYIKKRF